MKADEFAEKLAEVAPSVEYLISCGYGAIAEEIRNGYILNKREKPMVPTHDDPLIYLICNYDTSNFQIGMLTLGTRKYSFSPPVNKVYVGAIESDILVINHSTGAVELLDHAQPDFVVAECAASGGNFLEAILFLASFKPPHPDFKNLSREQQIENNQAAGSHATQCAKTAGISMSPNNIYEELLGYDPRK